MEAGRQRLWLILAASAFVIWIGYLFWLVMRHDRPALHLRPFELRKTPEVVVSRSQLLEADLVVSGSLEPHAQSVEGCEVVWHSAGADPASVGKTLTISNLALCKDPEGREPGAGRYLLPLVRDGEAYRVVAIPPTPGYPANSPGHAGVCRIYPDTPDARKQLEMMVR